MGYAGGPVADVSVSRETARARLRDLILCHGEPLLILCKPSLNREKSEAVPLFRGATSFFYEMGSRYMKRSLRIGKNAPGLAFLCGRPLEIKIFFTAYYE